MQKPSSVVPIAVAVLAIGGLVFANVMANNNRPKTAAEIEQEEQKAQEEQAKKNGAPSPSPSAGTAPMVALRQSIGGEYPVNVDLKDGSNLIMLGTDTTLPWGESTKSVEIGFEWTPELQSDPSSLSRMLDKLKAEVPDAQIRLVNVDENPGAPRGVLVNTKVVAPLGPDGNLSATAAETAIAELKKAK